VTDPGSGAAAPPAGQPAAPPRPDASRPDAPRADEAAEPLRAAAEDPALERERWLRDQLDRAQRRPAAEPGVVLHPSESGPLRFWRWLIDDLRSVRRAATVPPETGALAPLWHRFAASLPRPARRRRRRRRRR
jgi:hypothetical protein